MNQQNNPQAMPVDDYLTETIAILRYQPDVTEVQVDRVKFLRLAERTGAYDQTLAAVNSH